MTWSCKEITCWTNALRAVFLLKAIDGDRDVSDIHKIVTKLSAEIPGAKQEVLKDCGHIAPMENPEAFNKLLLEFLEAHSR